MHAQPLNVTLAAATAIVVPVLHCWALALLAVILLAVIVVVAGWPLSSLAGWLAVVVARSLAIVVAGSLAGSVTVVLAGQAGPHPRWRGGARGVWKMMVVRKWEGWSRTRGVAANATAGAKPTPTRSPYVPIPIRTSFEPGASQSTRPPLLVNR
ncbi:hypothetical protein BJ912DRAFT_1068879 [Pholiota molesta]|nr:hypothetical protein BJ912DRAFT_1068879 [Pholiota molesta]